MKNWIKYSIAVIFLMAFTIAWSQDGVQDDRDLQYFRTPGKKGINVFETSKDNTIEFTGVKTRLGGDFAMIFQGIDQSNRANSPELANLSNNFSLPTANLNIDVQLEDGLRMHLRTYLSSRHHSESWVKGGYIQMDKLDFVSEGFLSGFMDYAFIKVGMDDINYGDAHFRRSDNARAIYNPFVANYIMDAFTTEPFMEVTYQNNGILGVFGLTNGRLNQTPTSAPGYGGTPPDNGAAFYAKFGYDNNGTSGVRYRLTGSLYSSTENSSRDYLYGADRAGARYYEVFNTGSDFDPRLNPNFPSQTAIQINPFVKAGGLEFFGIYEIANNGDDEVGGSFTQLAGEVVYRLGSNERVYVAGRFNRVSGEVADGADPIRVNRMNFGGGWFMTDNVIIKAEYVSQQNRGNGYTGTIYDRAEFSGINLEAAISF